MIIKNFIQNTFSVKNENEHKIWRIFGITIKIKQNYAIKEFIREECSTCLELEKLKREQFKDSLEDSTRYISIVCSIFYVSLLTLFLSTSTCFTQECKHLFVISYTLSVGVFIFNEILNMLRPVLLNYYSINEWNKYYQNKIDLNQLSKNIDIKFNKLYKRHFQVWFIIFILGTASGLCALITLIFSAYVY